MGDLPIILYEGVEDHAFLTEFLKVLELEKKFIFHLKNGEPDCAGKDGFEKILSGLFHKKHKEIIIVADNDGVPAEAFINIQNQIVNAGFTKPKIPREKVETPNLSALSVLMIPWDNDAGCLETLCFNAANPSYKHHLEVCADGLVKCAGADWDIAKQAKLRMRGFLSAVCKSDPNTGLRYAWKRPERPFELRGVAAFNQIADFFKIRAA